MEYIFFLCLLMIECAYCKWLFLYTNLKFYIFMKTTFNICIQVSYFNSKHKEEWTKLAESFITWEWEKEPKLKIVSLWCLFLAMCSHLESTETQTAGHSFE